MKKMTIFLLTCLSGLGAGEMQTFVAQNALPAFVADELTPATTSAANARNPKLALAMSAVIPGSGQAYAKSYVKAAAFLGVEIASWAMYVKGTNEGKRIEDEFHHYADSHWSEPDYWRWIAHQAGIEYNPGDLEPLRDWEHASFSHGLHREKDQQYYEMIGKYHQFSWGWDDFRTDPENDISMTDHEITARYNQTGKINNNRYYYETRRDASNDAFKKATTATTVVIINHLFSAIDAAWTTTRYNRHVDIGLRLEPIQYAYETGTALTLRVKW
ncbi:hypothetical protein JXA02_05005 [candidate division KSB1 bacterium]|nr:hypothetical protein [candidate division KSB1 bacterium]RQW08437.1 MAG: hypothetical protein EH222_05680 [candidate division KSB1 bacterium]